MAEMHVAYLCMSSGMAGIIIAVSIDEYYTIIISNITEVLMMPR